jgi:hypothetical protein
MQRYRYIPAFGNVIMPSYIRNPEIDFRQLEETIFLVNKNNDTVLYLNQIGAGVWNILAKPTSPEEMIELIGQAFPDLTKQEISQDIGSLFERLLKKGLIQT